MTTTTLRPDPAPKRGPLTAPQQQLAASYLGLALAMAGPQERAWPAAAGEFESAAGLAVVEAARAFDPARGVPFGAYARKRIGGAMADVRAGLAGRSRRDDAADVADRSAGPVESVVAADFVADTLARVPAKQAAVLRLVVVEGRSHRNAAAALGRSKTRVSVDLAGALGTLRGELAAAA